MTLKTLLSTLGAAALVLASLALVPGDASAAVKTAQSGRVIVLGFDGADGRTVEELMNQGQLPNLKRLADQGTFAPLGTTNPAESPVSWASLNTGQNPAKTGIPGFVKRVQMPFGPMPIKGFAEDGVPIPIEELSGTPIPTWSAGTLGAAIGGAAFVLFLLVFGLLLRLKPVPTVVLSLILSAVGVWGGISMRGYLPATIPVVKNPLEATPFWEVAAGAGSRCVVLDAAQTWDREPVPGAKVLAGLGVPDARGGYNSFFVYTTDELWFADKADRDSETSSNGNKLRVYERDGKIQGSVYGPMNFWEISRLEQAVKRLSQQLEESNLSFKKSMAIEEEKKALTKQLDAAKEQHLTLPLEIVRKDGKAEITIGSQTQVVGEGEWSDWFRMSFEVNPLIKVHAITRARVVSLSQPYFEMYLNTLEIDPAAPPFWQPITQPASYAKELASAVGPFETVGWACMTMPFKDSVIDAVPFMEDIEFTLKWRERMTFDALAREDFDLFMSCFSTPDRVQHMMYQYYDVDHPLYDEQEAGRKMVFFGEQIELRDAIPAIYAQVDRLIGKVLDTVLQPGDTLLLCADHGFQSFRREVHVNNWLEEKGYLAVKPGFRRSSLVHEYVDWKNTRAYSIGLGMVFLNLKGREKDGIVDPAEADELLRTIRQDFLDSIDPETNQAIGHDAYLAKEIHSGPFLDREADLMLGFASTYRVSWLTTGGGLNTVTEEGARVIGPIYSDNAKNWSGDHVSVDPSLVRGIFFSNRKVAVPEGGVDLLHIAPTALSALGVTPPAEHDLAPLRFVD